jgi:hypothetical protein
MRMTPKFVWMLMLAGMAAGSAWAQLPAQPSQKAHGKLQTLSYTCRVMYEPAKSLWVRELQIDHDRKGFVALRIDGVPVHGFAAEGAAIQTHLDNERIALDLTQATWRSELRDQASGQGPCIKERKASPSSSSPSAPASPSAKEPRPRT